MNVKDLEEYINKQKHYQTEYQNYYNIKIYAPISLDNLFHA